MKKVGVITFHRSLNYGAFLQCFALQQALKKLNCKPSVINYETSADIERYKLLSFSSPKAFAKTLLTYPINSTRQKNFNNAMARLNLTSPNANYDVAITGSDQVWNMNLCGGAIDPMFTLEKINAKKKISYAASIGDESSVKKHPELFKKLINNLNHISVREQQAKSALNTISDRKIMVTIDPTALLTKNEWDEELRSIPKDNNDYLFSYFIGIRKDQKRVLAKICKKLNLKTTSYSQFPKEKYIYKYCYTEGPFQFLARLRDSKIVITSSFHGTILSIIMRKNFYVLMPHPKKRSRMDNILELMGLTDRIIETEADIDKINLDDIDYKSPQKKLDKLREESQNWLKKAIEN